MTPLPPAAPLIGLGRVWHHRLRPVDHAFDYPTYFLLLPMRSLREHGPRALVRNRFGLVSFHDRDHGDGQPDALAWFEQLLAAEGVHDADGEVWLHTYPRVLGYAFKPVSFWYALRRDGSLAAALAEVNNTFGERHGYLMAGPGLGWRAEVRARKVFHVSPFCAVQGDYRFRFQLDDPAAPHRTAVHVDLDDGGGPLLRTGIGGRLQPLDRRSVRRAFFGMPLMTLGVIGRIHWQALKLALRRVPFHRQPDAPDRPISR